MDSAIQRLNNRGQFSFRFSKKWRILPTPSLKCKLKMSNCIPTCFVAIRVITTPEDETKLNGFPWLKLELGFRNRNNPPNEAYDGTPVLDKFFIWGTSSELARAADERRCEGERWDYRLLSSYLADRLASYPNWRACSQTGI